jgi:hypothetical protein
MLLFPHIARNVVLCVGVSAVQLLTLEDLCTVLMFIPVMNQSLHCVYYKLLFFYLIVR